MTGQKCKLKCQACGSEYEIQEPVWRCSCGGVLDIVCKHQVFEPDPERRGVWRYHRSLPVDSGTLISLGEGGTPVLEKEVRGLRVFFKLEYLNPTGSFKDRGSSVVVTHLKSLKVEKVVTDSSGNAGLSLAAYASAAGLSCRVYAPRSAPVGKKLLVRAYGAELVEVESREAAAQAAQSDRGGFYAGHLWSPFFLEGCKTLAFEVFEEIGDVDAVVLPVGSGSLLLGVWRGFQELAGSGVAGKPPRLYAVQAENNAPLFRELYGREWVPESREVLADGIAVPAPPRLKQVASAIRESGGDVVIVRNSSIPGALKVFARMGFLVEPTSVVVLPALTELSERGALDRGERVLVPLTGSGLKTLEKLSQLLSL
ncbi:MAG: pyridoxal-phosphate dependent enzyme [Thermofilum sp.]